MDDMIAFAENLERKYTKPILKYFKDERYHKKFPFPSWEIKLFLKTNIPYACMEYVDNHPNEENPNDLTQELCEIAERITIEDLEILHFEDDEDDDY